MSKKVILWLTGVFLVLQIFQIDKTNPPSDPAQDFIAIVSPPQDIENMLRTACYDCHSLQTEYPWYTYTQPLGWWINKHIDEGRDELNFSKWAAYSSDRADHKLEEAAEYVLNEEMPLPSYTRAHSDARLSDVQRQQLAEWFESLRVPKDSVSTAG